MKSFLRRWTAFVLILCSLVRAYGQMGEPIQKIEIVHVGPAAASESLIRANIRVKEGDAYTRSTVDDDVRSLYATGYFYNIRVTTEPLDKGIKLTYLVQGKPVISEVRLEGNKVYSTRRLLKKAKATTKVGEPLDERKLFNDAQEMQKVYQKAGYQKTVVKYLPPVIEESAGRGTVTFEITEAPKVKVKDVQFVGAESFSQRKLRKQLKTRRHWMWSWITGGGVLKDEQFEEDKEKLADFYRNEGFIDFELKEVKFDAVSAKRMIIRLMINEGTRYKVGAVQLKGNTNFTSDQILRGIVSEGKPVKPTMTAGKNFTPKGLSSDTEAIRDFYGSKGYVDTYVKAVKTPNTDKGTIDLSYEVRDEDKGKSYVEKIEIRGNTKTKDSVLRRELAIGPGETFDMVRVKVSKSRLEQLNYFDKVETETEATDVPNRKNLVIDVEEGTTGHVELGAGFSSIDSIFGFAGYREGNFDLFHPPYFRGGGQKLRIGATIGLRRKSYELSFEEPWFLGRRLKFGVDLYRTEYNNYSSYYDVSQTGAKLSLTKQLPFNLIGSTSYTIEDIGIDVTDPANTPQIIKDEPKNRLISKAGVVLAHDTRNNALTPTRGERSEISADLAGGPLGGEADFYKLEARSTWYYPGLFEGHVIEVLGRTGVVREFSSQNQPGVPFFDRFFLGGVSSLRGYRYRRVGPYDPLVGEPIGGKTYWLGSAEYTIPIIDRLKFALFYDVGNAYKDAYQYNLGEYNDNYGFGLRLNIPRLGPLRLDYGIPITHDKTVSGAGRFQFSAGFTRDY